MLDRGLGTWFFHVPILVAIGILWIHLHLIQVNCVTTFENIQTDEAVDVIMIERLEKWTINHLF